MDNNYNNLQKMVLKPSEAIAYIFCYKIVLMFYNVISLGEVADFGKINYQLKNKYNAKRKRE
jgi:hypothetical protein